MGRKEIMKLEDKDRLIALGKALSSKSRVELLKLLSFEQLNVNEIAQRLHIPASSAAMNVRVLQEAGLIRTELKPGIRGSMKVCIKQVDEIVLRLLPANEGCRSEVISMPVGNFVDYKVVPTCGIVSDMGHIDEEDIPRCFYNPKRVTAKLIWFGAGYVEYRFSNARIDMEELVSVELSAELCSEVMDYNMNCKSDITVWINGIDAGTWTCPSDFGGRRGKLNPKWWPDKNTQFGKLKTWRLDENGTFIDNEKVINMKLKDYCLADQPYISVRFGIKEDAKHVGGINIFGDSFGDYPQDIVLKLNYQLVRKKE